MNELINITIDRYRAFEPVEGYYLAFSGGKDSIVIYELAKMSGVKFDAHYNVTTVDPPELVHFIRREYPEVKFELPKLSMWQLMAREKSPPTRLMRFCCKELKEHGGDGRFTITGVRWAESARRALKRKMCEFWPKQHKQILNPIIDWSNEHVWAFIKERKLSYCDLYDKGFERLGCVLCPMDEAGVIRSLALWPKIAEAYKRTFVKIIEARKESGLKCEGHWENGESLFSWWITRKKGEVDEQGQCSLIFD